MKDAHPGRNKVITLLLLLLISAGSFSCKNNKKHKKQVIPTDFAYDDFIEKMGVLMPFTDTVTDKKISSGKQAVCYSYFQNDCFPVWLAHGYKASDAADKFIAELKEVKWDGLDPEKYNLKRIEQLRSKLGGKETSLNDAIAFDTTVTASYLAVAKDLLIGEITPKKVDSLWFHANDSLWETPKLLNNIQQKYLSLNDFRSTVPTYKLLCNEYKHYTELRTDSVLLKAIAHLQGTKYIDSTAKYNIIAIINKEAPWITTDAENDTVSEWTQLLLAYQDYMGIKPTGKTDSTTLTYLTTQPDSVLPKITANLERIRWMQRDFGKLYVFVNIPLMHLFLRRDGKNAMQMRVVVGKTERQTPSIYALMTNIVINPPWGVPSTILKKDVLPGIQKSGSAYMAKKGLKAYTKEGKVVSVAGINSSNYRRYIYKQAPGDDNSLGYVKFNLPNPFDIYLHDTPHRGDFVKRMRALSSGCVRLAQPKEMAEYILTELENKKMDRENLDKIIKTHKTQWRILTNKIPVHISYLTAFEDSTNNHINYITDVYHRDNKLMAQLAKVHK